MGDKRKSCRDNHRYQEHGIGANLTRRICVVCGVIKIGQEKRTVLLGDVGAEEADSVLAAAG